MILNIEKILLNLKNLNFLMFTYNCAILKYIGINIKRLKNIYI